MCMIGVTSGYKRCETPHPLELLEDNVSIAFTCSGSPPFANRLGSQESIDVNVKLDSAERCLFFDAACSITSEAVTERNSWPASVAKEALSPVLSPEEHQVEQQPVKAGHELRGGPSSLAQRRSARVLRNRAPQSKWEAAISWDEAAWRRLPPRIYSTLCRTAATKHWQYFAELRNTVRARSRSKPYSRRPSRLHRVAASEELMAEWRRHKELCHASEGGPRSNETSSERAMQLNEATRDSRASDACAQLDSAVSGIKSANAQYKQCSCAAAQSIDGCTYMSMQQQIHRCS